MILEGKSLKKTLDEKELLAEIDIFVDSKKIYGLLGPNGAGKTTLFSILAGLIKPSDGEFFFDTKYVNNLNFEIIPGNVYIFKISKQLMNDSSRLVINDIKVIETKSPRFNGVKDLNDLCFLKV